MPIATAAASLCSNVPLLNAFLPSPCLFALNFCSAELYCTFLDKVLRAIAVIPPWPPKRLKPYVNVEAIIKPTLSPRDSAPPSSRG